MCSGSWRAGTEGAGQAGGFQKPEEARENSNETCILSYVKYIASPGSMYETGYSGLVHWDDPEQWDKKRSEEGGSGWGTHVHVWLIHVAVWQNHYNIIISLQ